MKKVVLVLFPVFLYAQTLSSLLQSASEKNGHIISKNLSAESKKQNLSSAKSSYLPTLDVGAFYQRSDD